MYLGEKLITCHFRYNLQSFEKGVEKQMITYYFIGVVVFWIIGLIVWNKIYPKGTEEDTNAD